MQRLEHMLDDLFTKVPYQLPQNARAALVHYMPWLTVIGGAVMLLIAWGVVGMLGFADSVFGRMYGVSLYTIAPSIPFVWLTLAILAIEAVMYFVAFRPLKARHKKGWNILFWVTVINIAESLVYGLTQHGYMLIGQLVVAVISSGVGLFLLFQIRSFYEAPKKPVQAKE